MGSNYAGFQRQPGKTTVQGTLEAALQLITGERTAVIGSGRTDAGAHALGQVCAFSTASALPPDTFRRALNAHLPDDLAVISACEVDADFHPRFEAVRRTYRYLIWNRETRSPFWQGRAAQVRVPLDERRMDEALQLLAGPRDMSSFVPARTTGSRVRTIFSASCRRDGDLITIEIAASGFMRQMVRALVGTVIRVGTGRLDLADFQRVVDMAHRPAAGDTAPAHGLYLVRVDYDLAVPQTNHSAAAAEFVAAPSHEEIQ
jgi:tRNA pseudouridine38-40 synthase